jgi:hypothetical protein
LSDPVGPIKPPRDLTPASGRQDHTILPSANNISRQRAVDRSQVFRPALRSRRAQNAAASIASLPAFVTMANAPLWGGTRKVLDVIWGEWEQKYFSEKQKYDSTALSTKRPTGKSLDCGESKFCSCPGRGAAFFTLRRRAGTYFDTCKVAPGSASRRKYGVLRSIRGTTGIRRSYSKVDGWPGIGERKRRRPSDGYARP